MAKITNITSTAIAEAAASELASSAPPKRSTSRKAAGVKPAARKMQSRQRAAKPEPAEVAPSAADGSSPSRTTKASIVLGLLRQAAGVSVADLSATTGWQAHSVRGFLSAVVRKKNGLTVTSDVGEDGIRRYRIPGDV